MPKPKHSLLTQQRLKAVLIYRRSTGLFFWRKDGSVAGLVGTHGHVRITVDRRRYQAHQLAWLYVRGSFAEDEIDHKNGVRADNRFCNLRKASTSVNAQNQRNSKGSNPLLGVSRRTDTGRWRATIQLPILISGVRGRTISLGCFDTAEEAYSAYVTAKRKLHRGCTI